MSGDVKKTRAAASAVIDVISAEKVLLSMTGHLSRGPCLDKVS